MLSHARLFATLWTVAFQAPLSMGSPGKNTRVDCHFLLYQKSILSLKIDSELSLTQNSLRHLLLFLRNLLLSIRIPSEISLFTSEISFLSEFAQNFLISSEFSQQSLFLPQKSASFPHNSLRNLPLVLINLHFSFRNLLSLRKFLYSVKISSEIFFF